MEKRSLTSSPTFSNIIRISKQTFSLKNGDVKLNCRHSWGIIILPQFLSVFFGYFSIFFSHRELNFWRKIPWWDFSCLNFYQTVQPQKYVSFFFSVSPYHTFVTRLNLISHDRFLSEVSSPMWDIILGDVCKSEK